MNKTSGDGRDTVSSCCHVESVMENRQRPGLCHSAEYRGNSFFELVKSCIRHNRAALFSMALAFAREHLLAAVDPLADSPDQRAWLWVQDKAALRLGGRP